MCTLTVTNLLSQWLPWSTLSGAGAPPTLGITHLPNYANLMDVKWCFIFVLIFILLISKEFEHFFHMLSWPFGFPVL